MSPMDAIWEADRLRSLVARRDAEIRPHLHPGIDLDSLERLMVLRYQLRQRIDECDRLSRPILPSFSLTFPANT